ETPPDPHPFRASANVLGAVLPGLNVLSLRRHGAGAWTFAVNLLALGAIVAGAVALAQVGKTLSPRPPLLLGGVAIDAHALQW
ncbi:hypothetical protein ABTL67_19905, partial [Acinetobacter baumannii]